ncbi:MAG: hypothetical protein GYB67_12835 [Chloroflexi bacterium]|nr:hypothetical protein [Chloroflexota bacterium]
MRRLIALLVGWCGLLAACTPPADPPGVWSTPITLAQADQTDAPALAPADKMVTAIWVGADDAGVHHDAVQLRGPDVTPTVVLPLPPNRPTAQQIIPADDDAMHLLWLDALDPPDDDPGAAPITRLYTALIRPDLTIERGPTPVADGLALRYDAVPDGDGGVWVVWSGDTITEPAIDLRRIDALGRPRPPAQRIADNAEWPTVARAADGSLHVYWLSLTSGQLMAAWLFDGALLERRALTGAVSLRPGDRLMTMAAGLDRAHGYVFWNITRAESGPETWLASGLPTAANWNPPRLLTLDPALGADFETDFRTALVHQPAPAQGTTDDQAVRWVSPLMGSGQHDALPIAAETDDGLGVAYLRGGEIAAYELVVPGVRLIGSPALHADADLNLFLAWAQPHPNAAADLRLITTRR